MSRILDALEKAGQKLKKDSAECASQCQDLGSIIADTKADIKQKEAYLATLVQEFDVARSNFDKVQGQLTLLEELKNSIA